MIGWVIAFLIIALIAAALGFGAIAGVAVNFAEIAFFIAIALFVIGAIVAILRGRKPPPP